MAKKPAKTNAHGLTPYVHKSKRRSNGSKLKQGENGNALGIAMAENKALKERIVILDNDNKVGGEKIVELTSAMVAAKADADESIASLADKLAKTKDELEALKTEKDAADKISFERLEALEAANEANVALEKKLKADEKKAKA